MMYGFSRFYMRLRLEKRFQEWILISFVLQQVYANITIIVLLLK